ncbi:LysR family transcriptional regulator [Bradyrhizobium quebecense]|uniref:LysR family transcriptional regulator n=1 Tax=Bradyrhizobium quebecense TaxID=2748629 RepID=A0A973WY84_9BRAD|nr:LysR family transcriptional regulator [Bradyrhizobium quebecense]UGA43271.1 LysR family transcriptional regulator [Bradyrhizobium quebecense]
MDQLAAMAAFVRAVETGSLSAAARSLPSSLTSVSRQISALEEHFGTRLLRTTRRLALTDDGRILYEPAKSILGEVREIEAALARDPHQPSGRIRLSSPSLIGRLVIAPLLVEFLRRYPAVAVDLLLIDRAVDMVEEDIHLAVRIGRLRDSQLVARKLTDLQMIVCASPDYLARRGEPRTPDDLAEHDCLVFSDSPGSAEWRFADGTKTGRKFRISGRLWMNSLEALVSAAREGAGIVCAPSWQVQSDLASDRLQRLLIDHEPAPTPLHLMLQPSRLASPKIRAFVDYLVEQWGKIDAVRAPSVHS